LNQQEATQLLHEMVRKTYPAADLDGPQFDTAMVIPTGNGFTVYLYEGFKACENDVKAAFGQLLAEEIIWQDH
jgi:hypothetical protein